MTQLTCCSKGASRILLTESKQVIEDGTVVSDVEKRIVLGQLRSVLGCDADVSLAVEEASPFEKLDIVLIVKVAKLLLRCSPRIVHCHLFLQSVAKNKIVG